MPDLIKSLQGKDLTHLQIIAEMWGITLEAPDARSGLRKLGEAIRDPVQPVEPTAGLPPEAMEALQDLRRNEGRMTWVQFSRRYGAVREMGPARRDRDKPHRNPGSVAEMLWYRALVARAFFDTPAGAQEFAYIPDEFLAQIQVPVEDHQPSFGRPASPNERAKTCQASDRFLDHACTLLAGLRIGLSDEEIRSAAANWGAPSPYPLAPLVLQTLLSAAGLLGDDGLPLAEAAREFLEAPRGEALLRLAKAWQQSAVFNELRQLPGLDFEGDWRNDPLRARQAVLDIILSLPEGSWWSLGSLVGAIRRSHPDFQRPAGDYDSWFIRDQTSGEFLRGFQNWEAVDGALIRYIIAGPMAWLGMVDLAFPENSTSPGAFRLSAWGRQMLSGAAPQSMAEEASFTARSDGRVYAPLLAPRAARYQLARFCRWEGENEDRYTYRLTPLALERARQQGLRMAQLMALLRKQAESLPPSLVTALERWDAQGTAARIEQATILRLSSPELLQALRNSRAKRFLGDPLGPTTVVIKPGAWQKVIEALAEMGYLGEGLPGEVEGGGSDRTA